jgi:hypothetical protein
MRALNQAYEDAAAFTAFRDALTQEQEILLEDEQRRRQGENRAQRRARERAERKAAKTAKVKS